MSEAMSFTTSLSAARQAELRERRALNEAAGRPPYAWTRLDPADIAWLIAEHDWSTDDTPGERANLRGANLARCDLRATRLRYAHLEGAILFGADLRGADLFYAHFTGSDLREAQAAGAQMDMARLRGARLNGIDLTGAHLHQCWLAEADLANAILDRADLRGAHLEHADLHEASLRASVMTWALATEADLRGATLAGADLRSVHLERALLDAADLRGANLEGAWCDQSSAYGARLEGADLRGSRWRDAQLAGAILTGARIGTIDLAGVDLSRIAESQALVSRPTGDEVAARALRGPARAQALRQAADGLDRLRSALSLTHPQRPALRRLDQRARSLRRRAWRVGGGVAGWFRWAAAELAYLGGGDGAAPGRIALTSLVVIGVAMILRLSIAESPADALFNSFASFTPVGLTLLPANADALTRGLSILEGLLGLTLIAGYIAALVRRSN